MPNDKEIEILVLKALNKESVRTEERDIRKKLLDEQISEVKTAHAIFRMLQTGALLRDPEHQTCLRLGIKAEIIYAPKAIKVKQAARLTPPQRGRGIRGRPPGCFSRQGIGLRRY